MHFLCVRVALFETKQGPLSPAWGDAVAALVHRVCYKGCAPPHWGPQAESTMLWILTPHTPLRFVTMFSSQRHGKKQTLEAKMATEWP